MFWAKICHDRQAFCPSPSSPNSLSFIRHLLLMCLFFLHICRQIFVTETTAKLPLSPNTLKCHPRAWVPEITHLHLRHFLCFLLYPLHNGTCKTIELSEYFYGLFFLLLRTMGISKMGLANSKNYRTVEHWTMSSFCRTNGYRTHKKLSVAQLW